MTNNDGNLGRVLSFLDFFSFLANEICEIENSWSQKLMLDPEELSILSRSISVELEIIDTSSNTKVTKLIEPERETKIQVSVFLDIY